MAPASTGSMNVPTPSVWSTPPAVVSTRQPATTATSFDDGVSELAAVLNSWDTLPLAAQRALTPMIQRLHAAAVPSPVPSPAVSVASTRMDPPSYPPVFPIFTGGGGGSLSVSSASLSVASTATTTFTTATAEQALSPVQVPTVGGGAVYYNTPVRKTPMRTSLGVAVVMRAEDRVKVDPTNYYQNKWILQEITASIARVSDCTGSMDVRTLSPRGTEPARTPASDDASSPPVRALFRTPLGGAHSVSVGSMNVTGPNRSTASHAKTSPSPSLCGGGGGGSHLDIKSVPPHMPAINDMHFSSGLSVRVPMPGTERVQLDHEYQSASVLLDVEEDIGGSSFMRRTLISVLLPVILVITHQFLRSLVCMLFPFLNNSLLLCDIQHLLQSIVYRVVLFLVTSSIWNLSSFGLFLYVCWRVVVTYSSTSTGLPRFQKRGTDSPLRSVHVCFRRRVLQVLPHRLFSVKAIFNVDSSASVCNNKVEQAGLFVTSASLDIPTSFVSTTVASSTFYKKSLFESAATLMETVSNCSLPGFIFDTTKASSFIKSPRSILESSSVRVLQSIGASVSVSGSERDPTPSPCICGGGGGSHFDNKVTPPFMPAMNDDHSSSASVRVFMGQISSVHPLSLSLIDPGIYQLLFAAAFAFALQFYQMDHIHYSLRVYSSLVLLLAVSFVAVSCVYKTVFFHGITSSSTLPMPVFKCHHRRRRRLDKHRIRRSYSTNRLFRRGPRLRPRRKPPYEHSSTHLDNIVLPTIASTLPWFVHPHVDDYIQRDTTSEGASFLVSEGESMQSINHNWNRRIRLRDKSIKRKLRLVNPYPTVKNHRICPRDKSLLGIFDDHPFDSTLLSATQSSCWSERNNNFGSLFSDNVVRLLGSRLKKKHRIVPMTHSYLFDCELAKSFYDRGLQQSTFDPCVFFSDKIVAVLFDGGTVFSAEFDQDIQDILFRFQEEDSTFNAQDIYSQSISTSSQVQDTEVLFPEGASSYFIIFLETCSRLAHRSRPNIEPIADELFQFLFSFVSSLSDTIIFQYLRKKPMLSLERLVCPRRSVIGD